jgi:DNA-binding phage protein
MAYRGRERYGCNRVISVLLSLQLNEDVETGKTVLRNYISAAIGFIELAEVTHRSPKSLMRMLGPKSNPQAQNLFEIVSYLLNQEGFQFQLRAVGAP